MKFPKLFFLLVVLAASTAVQAKIKLPAVIGSHMVLQRNSEAPVWGWGIPGEQINVTASWDGMLMGTLAGPDGKWMVKLKTPGAGGPHTIKISGSSQIVLEDVLVGEVWLCSGQSNMEWPLKGYPQWNSPVEGSEEAIASANYPDIRLFTVKKAVSFVPVDTCTGNWAACTPETAAEFSATGYFFGLRIYQKLNIPVGLIHSSWGGTPAEAWTSNEYISRIPKFETSPGICDPEKFFNAAIAKYNEELEEWVKVIGFGADENGPDWTIKPDGKGWSDIAVPAEWSETFIKNHLGVVEYQRTFTVPRGWIGKPVVLELGPIDEMDVTYVNGQMVGKHLSPGDYGTPRVYELPADLLIQGENILSLRVANSTGLGGINGKETDLKIRLKKSKKGQSLAGTWKARKSQEFKNLPPMPGCTNCNHPNTPTMLYNAMIRPIIPYGIKGAIWYQGESNRYDGLLYRKIFTGMIENWRHDWKQGDFPFYYVQIAPYDYRDQLSTGLLREAQEYAMKKLPNTGMVVTMDIGNVKNIHPAKKREVGERLAGWALAKDYGLVNTAYSGPLYRAMQKEGGRIRIHFDHTDGGLTSFGETLVHFQIAGADGVFKPAVAVIDDRTVLVSSEEVKDPVAVRFGWNSTDVTNLFNVLGLPAAPFRTDTWDNK